MLKEKLNQIKTDSTGIKLFVIDDILDNGESDDEILNYIHTVLNYGCASGCVSSLIYYYDTNKFFHKYSVEILAILDIINNDCGISFEINANNLAWLGYEETMEDIATELGIW